MAASIVIGIATLTHAARSATERAGESAEQSGQSGSLLGGARSEHSFGRTLARSVTPCADARRAVRWYQARARFWAHKMALQAPTGAAVLHHTPDGGNVPSGRCPQLHRAVRYWRAKAHAWRVRYETRRARFRALYEKWRCIHEHEGAWNANTGNGYYGGLQMTYSFQRAHGWRYLAQWGTANNWPVYAQLEAAEDAWHDDGGSFREWGTAGMCGLA